MDGRERLLTALSNEKPDRLPVQVHNWMTYYLDAYLDGCDALAAYERFGMDPVLYVGPRAEYRSSDLAKWQVHRRTVGTTPEGDTLWAERTVTPEGELTCRGARNAITEWQTECLIKDARDFALFERYAPAVARLDASPVVAAQQQVGSRGIVRGWAHGFGQGSPWQDLCVLAGTERAILWAVDEPEFTHHALQVLLAKRLRYIEHLRGVPLDLVEAGGGAASNTVISPALFREFVLPYDKVQTEALHAAGMRVVYPLCGGLMRMLDLVAEMGADGLETMTPPRWGRLRPRRGDAARRRPALFHRRVRPVGGAGARHPRGGARAGPGAPRRLPRGGLYLLPLGSLFPRRSRQPRRVRRGGARVRVHLARTGGSHRPEVCALSYRI